MRVCLEGIPGCCCRLPLPVANVTVMELLPGHFREKVAARAPPSWPPLTLLNFTLEGEEIWEIDCPRMVRVEIAPWLLKTALAPL